MHPGVAAPFFSVPYDVYLLIADNFKRNHCIWKSIGVRCLNALAQTCWHFNRVFNPLLWKSILRVQECEREALWKYAINGGYEYLVSVMLDEWGFYKPRDECCYGLLPTAILSGRENMVRMFLEEGADAKERVCLSPESEFKMYITLLQLAVLLEYEGIVELLAESAPSDLEYSSENDGNLLPMDPALPLQIASYRGNFAIVRALLDAGADPDARSCCPFTSLTEITEHDLYHVSIWTNLRKIKIGQTPLQAAILGENERIAKLLINRGANEWTCLDDLYLHYSNGKRSLISPTKKSLCSGLLGYVVSDGKALAIKYLFEWGMNPRLTGLRWKYTPLYDAIKLCPKRKAPAIVLAQHVTGSEYFFHRALCMASSVFSKCDEVVEILLRRESAFLCGPPIMTPLLRLHWGIFEGLPVVVRTMIQMGVDVNAKITARDITKGVSRYLSDSRVDVIRALDEANARQG